MNNPISDQYTSITDTTNENVSRNILIPIVSLFLAHEGFTGASTQSINVLVDVLENYIIQFGKTLNSYITTNTNHSKMIDSLHHACVDMNSYGDSPFAASDLKEKVERSVNEFGEVLSALERFKENPNSNNFVKMNEDEFLTNDDLDGILRK
jgi:hypothetical protein